MPTEALFSKLESNPTGLSGLEAERRQTIFGENRVETSQTRSLLHKIGQRVLNPLVAMLMAAAAVSGLSGDLGSFLIILAVVTLSLTLDITQEHRVELTAEAFRESVAIEADAVRDGSVKSVPVRSLVPGDIVSCALGTSAESICFSAHFTPAREFSGALLLVV
jgi:Mg2+-importing ATPase